MKRIFKRNQIIITTLAIMIAIAGYLNYSGSILEDEADTVSSDDNMVLLTDEISDSTYTDTYSDIISLDDDGTEEASADESSAAVGEAVLASTSVGDSILAEAKLNREQVRAKSKEELQEIINSTSVTEDQKAEAVTVMAELAEISDMEAAAELLLEAQGFDGCVVSITDGSVDVIVNEAELTSAQRAQIEDIITRKTNAAAENIIITPAGNTEE